LIPLIINEASKSGNSDFDAVGNNGETGDIEVMEGEYLQADEEESRA
jgi:hypothetical protein